MEVSEKIQKLVNEKCRLFNGQIVKLASTYSCDCNINLYIEKLKIYTDLKIKKYFYDKDLHFRINHYVFDYENAISQAKKELENICLCDQCKKIYNPTNRKKNVYRKISDFLTEGEFNDHVLN